jgi:CBS-domain-containing membrane protein
MTQTAAQQPAQPPPDLVTVADVMRPPLTTAGTNDHVAAAAYLMKHARASALTVLDTQTGQPKGILTQAVLGDAAVCAGPRASGASRRPEGLRGIASGAGWPRTCPVGLIKGRR